MMYELAVGLVLLGAFFYLWRGSLRAAAVRWVPDVIVAAVATKYVVDHTLPRAVASWHDRLDHARLIGDQSITLLSQAAIPFGSPARGIAAALVLFSLAAGLAAWLLAPDGHRLRGALAPWLLTGAAGFVTLLAGYLAIFPATYGAPLDAGVENRVNMIAAFGYVALIYAAAMIAATLVLERFARPLRWAVAVPLALAIVVAAGYTAKTRETARYYDQAYTQGQQVLGGISRAYEGQPPEASITYAFNFETFVAPGIPVFAWVWDMPGALKVHFQDPSIAGFPILPGTNWHCGKEGSGLYPMSPFGTGVGEGGPYGRSYFVDVATGRKRRIDNRQDCLEASKEFQPGPLKAGTDCALLGGGPATRLAWSCPESVWRRG
jgi:hypothetical protein